MRPKQGVEVTVDTFLIGYQHLHEFEGRAKHSTWLFQILNNVRRNHQRGQIRAARKHRAYAHESEHLEAALVEATRFDAESMLARRLLAEFIEEPDENVNTVQSRLRLARRAFDERFAGNQEVLRLRQALRERPPRAPASDRRRVQALVVTALELPRASLLVPHTYSLLLKSWPVQCSRSSCASQVLPRRSRQRERSLLPPPSVPPSKSRPSRRSRSPSRPLFTLGDPSSPPAPVPALRPTPSPRRAKRPTRARTGNISRPPAPPGRGPSGRSPRPDRRRRRSG